MTREKTTKINRLLESSPHGAVLTTTWLKNQGISEKLAWWYVQSGWLKHLADGAYCFAAFPVRWVGAVNAVQQQLNLPVHIAAKTALQLAGKSHYVPMRLNTIQLFGTPQTKLPRWTQTSTWNESFILFCPKLFNKPVDNALIKIEVDGLSLTVSAPERAALELCYLVPQKATFEETALILESLSRMRSKLLQALLESCTSYKAKRLLLYLGDHFGHPWMSELDLSKIDLGKGKRVIAGGGCYNARFQVSVPELGDN